ncbi:MAG: pentapeptide repeat-containing protein [Desulfobulbaceae bacterium]|nr:pentapeptide repeat-containing protein [Desulfobulbaceae bacterium]
MQMRKLLFLLMIAGACFFPASSSAFVQEDLDRLLKTNQCPKCDLSGAVLAAMDLSKAKLEGADLSGADLSKTSLRMADMAQVNLAGANISGAVFEAADLFQANLTGANVADALFGGAYLAEAKMDESQKGRLASQEKASSAPQLQIVEADEEAAQKARAEVAQEKASSQEATALLAKPGEKAAAEVVMEDPPVGETGKEAPPVVVGGGVATAKSIGPDPEVAPLVADIEKPESGATSVQLAEKTEDTDKVAAPAASVPAEVESVPAPVVEKGEEKVKVAVAEDEAVVADKGSSSEEKGAQEKIAKVEAPESAVLSEQTAGSPPVVEGTPQVKVPEAEAADSVEVAAPITPEALLKQAKKSKVCVECDFSGMALGSVSMKGFYLERANFAGAQMAGANFKEANLKSAKFSGANLQGATFKGADLYLADFSGANLNGADFRGAAMDGATLGDATLTGAQLDEVKK